MVEGSPFTPEEAKDFKMDRDNPRSKTGLRAKMLAGLAVLGVGGIKNVDAAPTAQKVVPPTASRITVQAPQSQIDRGEIVKEQPRAQYSEGNLDAFAAGLAEQGESEGKIAEGIQVFSSAGELINALLVAKPENTIIVLSPSLSDQLQLLGAQAHHFENGVIVSNSLQDYLSASPEARKNMPEMAKQIESRFDGADQDSITQFLAVAGYHLFVVPSSNGEKYLAWQIQKTKSDHGITAVLKPVAAPEAGKIEETLSAGTIVVHFVDQNPEQRDQQMEPDRRNGARRTVGVDLRPDHEVTPEDVDGKGVYLKVGKGLPASEAATTGATN